MASKLACSCLLAPVCRASGAGRLCLECKSSKARLVTLIVVLLSLLMQCQARKMMQAAAGELDTVAYTCIESGVAQHPCVVNPAYTFATGFKTNTDQLADRVYQQVTAQHVVCQQYTTQAACQAIPAGAQVHCSWDSLNSRCLADPYASLMMPLSCPGSKARSYMNCGRRGHINACRTDTECVLGKQNRCFPAWLVSEARAKNTTEQEVAEATALAILKGNQAVLGSCPEAKLLQHAFQACPYTAGWDTCDTSLCEFSTPSFIPSRVQPLGLGNTTATVPTINEAAQQPNSTTELPFFDTYPGPICFPDVARTSMVLHGLLGVSAELAKELEKLQARCVETEDVVFDVARGVAACGLEMFSYDSGSLYKAVGMQPPVVLPVAQGAQAAPATQSPAQQQASAGPAVQKQPGAAASPAAAVPALAAAATAPAAAAAAGAGSSSAKAISGSSSSSSNGSGGSSVMGQQQRPKVATEIGYRSHVRN